MAYCHQCKTVPFSYATKLRSIPKIGIVVSIVKSDWMSVMMVFILLTWIFSNGYRLLKMALVWAELKILIESKVKNDCWFLHHVMVLPIMSSTAIQHIWCQVRLSVMSDCAKLVHVDWVPLWAVGAEKL